MSDENERPILFSGPMVRAILAGDKTQTRRLVKRPKSLSPDWFARAEVRQSLGGSERVLEVYRQATDSYERLWCPWSVGTQMWVRETWAPLFSTNPRTGEPETLGEVRTDADGHPRRIVYAADAPAFEWCDGDGFATERSQWRSPIFMPRWASRITLEVLSVRVERLHEITTADIRAEGVQIPCALAWSIDDRLRAEFARLWDKINGKRATWASNPWVWVVSFRREVTT